MFMLDRIEKIMEAKTEESEEASNVKSELPMTKFFSTTKTSWQNFQSICTQISREPQHVLDFYKSELDTEGNFGSEGNLILQGKFKDKHIIRIYKLYIDAYVRCVDCKRINTEMTKDSNTRLQNLKCLDCGATRTVQSIKKGYHAVKRGERKREKNKVT